MDINKHDNSVKRTGRSINNSYDRISDIKNIVGFMHVRAVNAIRYPIYKQNDKYFWGDIVINVPDKFRNCNNITIVLSTSSKYCDYQKEINDINFPKYVTINNEIFLNDGIISPADVRNYLPK